MSIGANQQRKMYGKVARRTVAVRGHCGTVRLMYADIDDHKRPSRPVEADFRISLLVTMCDMMTKYAPVPVFK